MAAAGLDVVEAEDQLCAQLLPSEPLLLVLSFLGYRDLISCRSVCRRFHQLCSHDPLWKRHCKRYWLLSEGDKAKWNIGWMELFRQFYCDLGRYIDHYAEQKRAWEDLKEYLGRMCPRMIASLNAGITEEELDAVEKRIHFKIPNDYRCSLRIHNGQRLVVPGLMGSMALSSHYRSEDLLDIDTAAGGFQQRKGLKHCLPLTFCIHTGLSQYMALDEVEGRKPYDIFYHCVDQMASDPSVVDMFITGSSFTEWFTTFVFNVTSGRYPIIRDQIFRYVHDERCVARTGDIIISVSTSFLPELSSVHPPHYFYSYRIRVSCAMDNIRQKENTYKKEKKPWGEIQRTKDDKANSWKIADVTRVFKKEDKGKPGNSRPLWITVSLSLSVFIQGEFPVLRPGTVHEYTSCTTFTTPSGYMEGYYTFHQLSKHKNTFNVAIPRFYMVCPPFRGSTARQNRSNLDPSNGDDIPPPDRNNLRNPNMFVNFPPPLGRCPRHT
ncbi:F-box only protein 3 [Heterodontus francisci]|uniref:F-box only protein 3 n=1 Tax=Heterodontus francisci TaxID=7792 RepID=UPI00355B37F3